MIMFSLIVTTRGDRTEDLERFLKSIQVQTCADYEIIVVDQSERMTEHILSQYSSLFGEKLVIVPSEKVSLSKARNIGLKSAKGAIVAFPDDDCWYEPTILERVHSAFAITDADCICCGAYDPIKNRYLTSRVPKQDRKKITVLNSLALPISIGIFVQNNDDVYFDEELGVGAKWGGGEESDLILRLLKNHKKIEYFRDIKIYHPYNNAPSFGMYRKNYSYGTGYGALIKKSLRRKQFFIIIDLFITMARSVGGVLYYTIKKDERKSIYTNRIRGIFEGLKHA